MGYSYKTYTDIKDIMKKYVNASEGAIMYGMGKTTFMTYAGKANAIYKVGESALVNTALFEKFLQQFKEEPKPLPKHYWGLTKGRKDNEKSNG